MSDIPDIHIVSSTKVQKLIWASTDVYRHTVWITQSIKGAAVGGCYDKQENPAGGLGVFNSDKMSIPNPAAVNLMNNKREEWIS